MAAAVASGGAASGAGAAAAAVPIVRPATFRALSAVAASRPTVAASHTIASTALPGRARQLASARLGGYGRSPSPRRGGAGGADDDAALGIYDDDEGEGEEEVEALLSSLSSRARASYHASQLARPVLTVEPDDVSPALRQFARRDLLHSASKRVASARARGRVDPATAGVASAVLEWQSAARREIASARAEHGSAVGDLLRTIDAGMAAEDAAASAAGAPPHGRAGAGGGPGAPPLFSTLGIALPPVSASGGLHESAVTAKAAAAQRARTAHVGSLTRRYGAGAMSGGAGTVADRFLIRRQLDVIQQRNEAEVERALREWRERKATLDAEIEARIAARRRPDSVNLLDSLDYSGSVRGGMRTRSAGGFRPGHADRMRELAGEDDGDGASEGKSGAREDEAGEGKGGDSDDDGGGSHARSREAKPGHPGRRSDASGGSGGGKWDDDGEASDGGKRPERLEYPTLQPPLSAFGGDGMGGVGSAGRVPVPTRQPAAPRLRNPVVVRRTPQSPGILLRPTSAAAALIGRTSGAPLGAPPGAATPVAAPAGMPRSDWWATATHGGVPLSAAAVTAALSTPAASAGRGKPPLRPTPGTAYVAAYRHHALGSAAMLQTAVATGALSVSGVGIGGGVGGAASPGGFRAGGGLASPLATTSGSFRGGGEDGAYAGASVEALSRQHPLDVLASVHEVRERLQAERAWELDKLRAMHESGAISDAAIDAAERALATVPAVPPSLHRAALQAANLHPVAKPPVMRPTSAPPGKGGKGAAATPKPSAGGGKKAPAGKGKAVEPAVVRPFPGQGIGLLTGDTRPYSAAAGGGASIFGYPENPLLLAARLQAIRDDVMGVGKKKGKKKAGGKAKAKK